MVVKSESRAGTPISLIAIHTNEGDHAVGLPDNTAENLAKYLDRANLGGESKSYHVICDDDSTVRYVPDDQASWSMLAGNKRSLGLCFTGWAAWPRSEWLAHDAMLRRGSVEVYRWCVKYQIPIKKLTPAQVGSDWWGICGHWDWTLGKRNGNHTDPGSNFPWDVFIRYVQDLGVDMQPEEHDVLYSIHTQLAGPGKVWDFAGWPAHPDNTAGPKTLVDYVRAMHAMQRVQAQQIEAILSRLDTLGTKQ